MTPGAHFLISWLSTVEVFKNRRERVLVSLSGVAPDIDGLGLIADKLMGTSTYYFQYHHHFGHNIFSAILLCILSWYLASTQKLLTGMVSFFVVHLHILCDVVGSKGPDGYQWPVYYLYPLNTQFTLTWSGQWELNAWQNQLVLLAALALCVYYAASKQVTFFEVFGNRFNEIALNLFNKISGKSA